MTLARLRAVVPDLDEARVFLAQARRFVADAASEGVSGAGRQLLLYQACVAACDAGLRAAGFTVEGSDGGHVLRFDETAERLGLGEDLLERLHDARDVRGGSAYAAGVVFEEQAGATKETADELLEAVARFIEEQADQ